MGAPSPVIADVSVVKKLDGTASVSSSTATMVISADEPVLPGHYPGFPIFPGTCLIECMHRSCLATAPAPDRGLELVGVESARFLSPVFPGERLKVRVDWTAHTSGWQCAAQVRTARGEVANARLCYRRTGRASAIVVSRPAPPAAARWRRTMGPAEIQRVLPHRYPMLLLDRVVELIPGGRVAAVKAVTCTEPWYARLAPDAGPDDFAYPATLLVESWCQAAGVLATWDRRDVAQGAVMLFGGLTDARFHRPVQPGELVEHRVEVIRAFSDTMVFAGESVCGDQVVMSIGRMVMALRPAERLQPAVAT